jgi:hypothetical protein
MAKTPPPSTCTFRTLSEGESVKPRIVANTRTPNGEAGGICPGCERVISVPAMTPKRPTLVFINRYEGEKWVSTELWHPGCYGDGQ